MLLLAGALLAPLPSLAEAESAAPAPAVESAPKTSAVSKPVPSLAAAVAEFSKAVAGMGGRASVAILDVDSGELLAADHDRVALNPASNAKLFTAAAALARLSGNYRFQTGLYGERKGSSVGTLVLRGHGDPSLRTKDLWEMVKRLDDMGIKRVDGDILVDQRFFDEDFVPPAFEQQPHEWSYFRAPVSAVALNSNTIAMNVQAGGAGEAAKVFFDPPGFVDIDGTIRTIDAGKPQNVILSLAGSGKRLSAKIGGHVPASAQSMRFVKRVEDPSLLAGYALKALLTQAGIQVKGDVKAGSGNPRSLLAQRRSEPLATLLYEVGKMSDNFYAEMIFKTLGAEKKGRPGKSENGAQVVSEYLAEIGALEEGTVIKNGSGLFDANRISALALVKLLRAAHRDPSISPEFVAHLAIGGVDGTLQSRFRSPRSKGLVRAKTGTLNSVATLSGYVFGAPGEGPLAFSILVNDVPGKVGAARQAMDKLVEAMIRHQLRAP